MDQRVKQLWVDALRSGEYKQGRDALKINDGQGERYCCLGVLCDLYAKEYPKSEFKPAINLAGNYDISGALGFYATDGDSVEGFNSGIPPELVCKWANLPSPNPSVDNVNGDCLTELNDIGTPFATIADIIEKQF